MILDKKGHIYIENLGVEIKPGLTNEDFVKCLKNGHIMSENYGDWIRYKINPLIIDGNAFASDIGFHKNRIACISIVLLRSAKYNWERKGKDWDTWTMDEEIEVNKLHNDLLINNHGTSKKEFEWGSFFSNYDNISGFSHISIKFKSEIIDKSSQSSSVLKSIFSKWKKK